MTLQSTLEHLRDRIDGCQLTAFGDLSSGLILRYSTDGACAREDLDRIADTARLAFAIRDATAAVSGGENAEGPQALICFDQRQAVILDRRGDDLCDLTCAIVDPSRDVSEAMDAVGQAALQIETENG